MSTDEEIHLKSSELITGSNNISPTLYTKIMSTDDEIHLKSSELITGSNNISFDGLSLLFFTLK